INAKINEDPYPIPKIRNLLDVAAGHSFYSSLDLKSSFNQLPIKKESQCITAFTHNHSQFVFKGAPFGIKTLSAIFQRVTSQLLHDFPFVIVYIDDILIFSNELSKHQENVIAVLERLTSVNLT